MNEQMIENQDSGSQLVTTFFVGNECYGIEVMKVQEVTGKPLIIPVPLAPDFVRGLINLRGQLATALGLRELFGNSSGVHEEEMSVVCRADGNLVSLIVDQIGEVVETEKANYESPPETIPHGIRRFVKGIYKMNDTLLSVLDLEMITRELSPSLEMSDGRTQN